MSYRERRMRRAERLRTWAETRQQTAAATLKRSEAYRGDHVFNTQPGHIPERARLIAREDRAVASLDKAARMDRRADEIERQADRAIYDDDPDACERLRDRIAGLETRRDRMKAINRAIRKGAGWEARITPTLTEAERAELASLARTWAGVYKPGYPPYALQNLAGNITRQRQRLARLLTVETQRAAVREAIATETPEPDPSPAATLEELAATLNQDAPLIADCPFTLTPPPSGPTAAQQSLFVGPPRPDAECPLCDGTGRACIATRASGENVIGACDACRGTGRMDADEAAALDRRIRETHEDTIRRIDARIEADENPHRRRNRTAAALKEAEPMRPLIPAIVQCAFIAWLTHDAYRDAAGRYRLRSKAGRIAPWSRTIAALYPDHRELTRAAARWLHLWDAVPLARLAPFTQTTTRRTAKG